MSSEKLTTKDENTANVNVAIPRGTYRVTAKDGVQVDGDSYDKGDEVKLQGAAIQALLNDGSIEPV
jgi:hypothetical protein